MIMRECEGSGVMRRLAMPNGGPMQKLFLYRLFKRPKKS